MVVTGLYAGNANMPDVKGLIYADLVHPYMELGYRAVTIKELLDHPLLYFQSPVCIECNATQIVLAAGKTDLKVDDGTGTIDVLYLEELDDLKIDEGVIIEGEFQRNTIYAFTVTPEHPEPTPSPSPSPSLSPTPAPTPAAPTTPSTTFTPVPMEEEGLPFIYLIVIIIAIAAVGVFGAIKLRKWLMFRRYG